MAEDDYGTSGCMERRFCDCLSGLIRGINLFTMPAKKDIKRDAPLFCHDNYMDNNSTGGVPCSLQAMDDIGNASIACFLRLGMWAVVHNRSPCSLGHGEFRDSV